MSPVELQADWHGLEAAESPKQQCVVGTSWFKTTSSLEPLCDYVTFMPYNRLGKAASR